MLNKLDLVPEEERAARVKAFVKAYRWKGPVFPIAAINGDGCRELVFKIQEWLDAHPAAPVEEPAAPGAMPEATRAPRRVTAPNAPPAGERRPALIPRLPPSP